MDLLLDPDIKIVTLVGTPGAGKTLIASAAGLEQTLSLSDQKSKFKKILIKIADFLRKEKTFSTFIVIKRYNEKGKYLNYSGNGYSISFDFKINKYLCHVKYP